MKSTPVIHPFLFTLYPLLVTISLNFWQVSSLDIARFTLSVLLFCGLLLLSPPSPKRLATGRFTVLNRYHFSNLY